MGEKYKDIYRIEPTRKPNWDYSWDGMYYVTICTGGRELFFGDVINGQMILSDIGQKANEFWRGIPEHFKFVRLDEFQIMPDHVHGLIEINHNLIKEEKISDNKNVDRSDVGTANLDVPDNPKNKIGPKGPKPLPKNGYKQVIERDEMPKLAVSTTPKLAENRLRTIAASKKWKPGTLGTIINQYKRAVTIDARKINSEFYWQTRFYDSIVNEQKSLDNIRNYIRNNPKNWAKDELDPDVDIRLTYWVFCVYDALNEDCSLKRNLKANLGSMFW